MDNYNTDNLRPVIYTYTPTEKVNIGLIAHELQEYYPFLVEGEKDSEHYQSINYLGLIGLLIKEIQELKKCHSGKNLSVLGQHTNSAYNTLITSNTFTISQPYYQYYSISPSSITTDVITLTLPEPSESLLGLTLTFRLVSNSHPILVNSSQTLYDLTNSSTTILLHTTNKVVTITIMPTNSTTYNWYIMYQV